VPWVLKWKRRKVFYSTICNWLRKYITWGCTKAFIRLVLQEPVQEREGLGFAEALD
jgi:hypothetical protein